MQLGEPILQREVTDESRHLALHQKFEELSDLRRFFDEVEDCEDRLGSLPSRSLLCGAWLGLLMSTEWCGALPRPVTVYSVDGAVEIDGLGCELGMSLSTDFVSYQFY
mmetsp:Transcript_17292/g.26683  ORF Transcript_17292/g.26683 Transcript_17292/m.26683 type:complete len:108 (+) Transcript_17292:65-388(+)